MKVIKDDICNDIINDLLRRKIQNYLILDKLVDNDIAIFKIKNDWIHKKRDDILDYSEVYLLTKEELDKKIYEYTNIYKPFYDIIKNSKYNEILQLINNQDKNRQLVY